LIYTDETYDAVGTLLESKAYDTAAQTVTTTVPPAPPETRPMTPDESAAYAAREASDNQALYGSTEAIVAGLLTSYSSTQSPDTAAPWVQPTGAHDGYLPGTIVTHAGASWRNDLTVMNVWEPGTQGAGWTDLSPPPSGPQPWVQPTGGHDAYNVGDQVTHNGATWTSTVAANVWEPGVFGWVVV
jgi:hypothetical protein